MVKGFTLASKEPRFARPPSRGGFGRMAGPGVNPCRLITWHARPIERSIEMFDLEPLFDSYLGVGKKALRPDLLFGSSAVRDAKQSTLAPRSGPGTFGSMSPCGGCSSACSRLGRVWMIFATVARPSCPSGMSRGSPVAVEEQMTPAPWAALDSSSVAAQASRRQLLHEERWQKRPELIEERLQPIQHGEALAKQPGWLA